MVEPAGAMAMFVLRLAGLLSLENALQDKEANLTDSMFNLTNLSLNQSLSPVNLTWFGTDRPAPVPNPAIPRESSFTIDPQEPTSPTLRSSAPSTTVPTTSSTTTLRSTNITTHPSTYRAQDKKTPVPPINVNYNKNTQKFNRRRNSTPNARRRKFTRGSTPSGHTESTISSQTAHIGINSSGEMPALADTSIDQQLPRPKVSDVQRSEDIPEVVTSKSGYQSHAQRETESGESARLVAGSGSHISHIMSDYTSELYPESFSEINPLPVTASLQPRPEMQEPPPSSSSLADTARPQPRLEMLAEEDDQLLGLLDHIQLRSLEAPPEDFVESDFEYYDFGAHHQDIFHTEAPNLSSLNLVSAVPSGRFAGAPVPSEPIRREYSEETRQPQPTRPRKLPPARPIPPTHPRSGMRNNPYPYGPKLLPGPYVPLTPNLPSATEDEHHDRPIPTEYSYEEDFDYYYDSSDSDDPRYAVQTKEPPVLFVFDRPGYTPEAPTTLLPATRSPTPSDPWDCAPRCPRYTLLDWNTDYDVRQYPYTSWVSTVIISENRVLAELEGYMRVQDYFYGLNDQGMLLNITIPFVTQIKFGKHPGVLQETNDYTISLYVQPTYTLNGAELPTPISNEVLVDALEQKTVFVHSFEANVWDVTDRFLEDKVETLMTQLRHNGEAFLDRYYYLASYSRPELYQPVYYEVWVYATNFRDPQTPPAPSSSSIRRMHEPPNKVTQKTLSKLCRGVECPTFDVLRTYKYGIQKRRYYNGLFASTSPRECQFTTMSVWKGFMPLHLYKHGINSHMEVIEATRPIALVNIRDSSDPNTECPQNMTMSLYLPKRLHSNPPITGYAAPDVRITSLNDVIVYAYTVGGYLLDPKRVRKELADMKYRLSEFGACYKDDEYYVVIYDFIVRYHGRQNEIWIVAENCKATHNG